MGGGCLMFYLYTGDNMEIPTDENHLIFRWDFPECKVLFSVCKRGDAASCHIASDKKGLRFLKVACNEFFDFVMNEFKWCERVMVAIKKPSVCRLVEKIGFELLGYADDSSLYMRVK